jgi:hypothetical protein
MRSIRSRRRSGVLLATVASILAAMFVTAAPSMAYTWVTSLTDEPGQALTYNGIGVQNISGPQQVQFYLDGSGHALLRRVSDGAHCASWPSPSTAAPGSSSSRRAIYIGGSYQEVQLQYYNGSKWLPYYTIHGNTALGGSDVDIELYSGQWNLYIGKTRIHGC